MTRRGTILSTLFAVVLFALPSIAGAQSHAEAVWTQLNRAYNQVNGDGFGSRNYLIGRMANGASDSWSFTLPGGTSYKIVGVCDNDCKDLDIRVSLNDDVVAEDILDDDVPIVNFTAKSEARYSVRVTMATCSADPCFWGIAVFYK
jgi:hypothetical protein